MSKIQLLIRKRQAIVWLAVSCFLVAMTVHAQKEILGKEAYLRPPKEIEEPILASRADNITLTNLSPDGKKFLITRSDGLPSLELLGHSYVHLAENIFDPVAGRSRALWVRSNVGYDLYYYADNRTVPLQIPEHARVSNPVWSPDGSKLAFYAFFDEATYIYVADTDTGRSRRLAPAPVLATLDTTFQWSKDGKRIQTVLLPDDGKREVLKPGIATEPKVRVARGGLNPSRTYRYLLESPYDMKLLDELATGQLALINLDDGKVTKIGSPAMIRSVSMAPGEQDFRIDTLKKPFSYYVPLTRFGSQEGIWNLEGKSLYTLNDRKLQETEPQPAAQTNQALASAQGTGRRGGGRRGQRQAQPPANPTQPTTAPLDPNQPPVDPTDPNQPPTDPDSFPRARQQPADPNGRRDIAWLPDGGSMSFLQLEPAGKSTNDLRKDQVMQWLPPFGTNDVKVLYATTNRIAGVQFSEDGQMVFLTQTISNQRQISAIDLKDTRTNYVIYKGAGAARGGGTTTPPPDDITPPIGDDDLSQNDFDDDVEQARGGRGGGFGGFGGAGAGPNLMTRFIAGQINVVRISSTGDVYLTGTDRVGSSTNRTDRSGGSTNRIDRTGGNTNRLTKPYIDKVNIKTGAKTRIFEGKGDMPETIDAVNGDDIKLVFTTRQKPDVVPDSYLNDLQSGKVTKLTTNVNRTAWFNQLKVERIQVTRVDGFKFWVKVTTPPDRTGKLPAMFWIYPREYTNQAAYNAAAGRTAGAGNTNRFQAPGPRTITILCRLDYAVVEPDIPIIGPPNRMNDNYVPDLRNSLWAVIDELDKRGIIDRDRLAVGGHSYGAFSTANALAHTPFFKAGIAGDGNYNRTLTTMTFQTERRNLWDARETYLEMSPILWANQVNGALLMYHSMDDANVGTDPLNAEHMFMALDGLGKPAALYMYPYEDHGPLAKETILDQWARWVAWLDTYVKNPKKEKAPDEPKPATSGGTTNTATGEFPDANP